ncbi:superfamily II DNA/RNA helicase [Striga asiatica]|uniref:Superfamily II DNA/RNA helicase n=1 Tax=Striga asiatica TaxID=4170 RepID=A0A5A7P1Z8_STRAF|nr:superfamily II DNA/RNA helicase [Striga asiatica]
MSHELILYLAHGLVLSCPIPLPKHAINLIHKYYGRGDFCRNTEQGSYVFFVLTKPFGSDGGHGDVDEAGPSFVSYSLSQHCFPSARWPEKQYSPARLQKPAFKEVGSSERYHNFFYVGAKNVRVRKTERTEIIAIKLRLPAHEMVLIHGRADYPGTKDQYRSRQPLQHFLEHHECLLKEKQEDH